MTFTTVSLRIVGTVPSALVVRIHLDSSSKSFRTYRAKPIAALPEIINSVHRGQVMCSPSNPGGSGL